MNTTKFWLPLSITVASLLSPFLFPQKAVADEVWSTDEYDVVYEEDRGSTAIWSYGDGLGTIFIDGLAGVIADRSDYTGYWTQETSSRRCDTFREGPDGEPTYHWGRFEITFVDADFPSRWYANFGLCDGPLSIHLDGTPIVGEGTEGEDTAEEGAAEETDSPETEPSETRSVFPEQLETNPSETDPPETEPSETRSVFPEQSETTQPQESTDDLTEE